MEVYIEDIVLDNLIIDFLILYISSRITKIQTKFIWLFLGCLFGVLSVFLTTLVNLSGILLLLFKTLCGICMCLIAFKFKGIKQFLLVFFTFLFTTALVGGLCFLISFSFGEVVISESGSVGYELGLPMWVIVSIVGLVGWLLFQLLGAVKNQINTSNFLFTVEMVWNDKTFKTTAFLDTGNTLCDPVTQKPVCVLTLKLFQKIFKEVPLHQILLSKNIKCLPNCHYIEVGSVSGKNKMLVFEIPEIKIFQKKLICSQENVCLGLTFTALEKKLDANLLLNSKIF